MKTQHPVYSVWQGIGPGIWNKVTFGLQAILFAALFWMFATLMFCL